MLFLFEKSQTIGQLGQERRKKYYLCKTPSGVIMSTRHCLGQKWRFMITKDFKTATVNIIHAEHC